MTAVEKGDTDLASRNLNDLLDTARQLGVQRFPLYARAAASYAREASQLGKPELAKWSIAAAEKLDPRSADVQFTAAELALEKSDPAGTARHLARGIAYAVGNYTSRTLVFANLLVVFWVAIGISAIVFAIALFARYSRVAAHDLRERLSERFGAGTTTVLAFAVLFLPLFLWLGPIWLILYWFVVFFAYATVREKAAIATMLVALALIPVGLDWTSYLIAGADSPIVRGAADSIERSYDPEVIARLRDLAQAVPDNGRLQLLLGNLEFLQGNDSAALLRLNQAAQLDQKLAGAHLNIGNIHFLNSDIPAAVNEYKIAEQTQPDLAIAYYNHSVASGELYHFDEQGQQVELARKYGGSMIERLLANRPQQKIVRYDLPMSAAWSLDNQISGSGRGRETFGSYAAFSPLPGLLNALSIGALLSIALAFGLASLRKRNGLAGICIKCGRTFCHRCKSSRESATYCTQCIHIYLKRDGVAVATKRNKVTEVQQYQSRVLRVKKLLATFLPGTAQIVDGSTLKGLIALIAFLAFVAAAILIGDLAPVGAPSTLMKNIVRVVTIVLAIATWIAVSVPVYKQKIV
ncbi:MAG: tetratricopeptide repeat protein [Thermoanaerobaculia bacterium]